MILNIYDKKTIVKTYRTDTYDLLFGVLEDVANAINLDALQTGSDVEILKMIGKLVIESMDTIKDLLKDIFDGITDEEIRHTRVNEISTVLLDVARFSIGQLNLLPKSKN